MSCQGHVKSFNDKQGWGFIDYNGIDVFLHIKDCGNFVPKQGAQVCFDTEDSPKKPGQKCAKNIGVPRTGKCEGSVKSFVDKQGYGFIEYQGGDVFLHINDCVDGRPIKGDLVNFDIEDSDKKPGQKTAKHVVGCSGSVDLDAKGKGKGKDFGFKGDFGGKGDYGCKGGKDGWGGGGYDCKGGYGPYDCKGGWGGPPPQWGGGYDCKGGWGGPPDMWGKGYDCKGGGGGWGGDCKGGWGSPYDCKGGKGFDKGGYGVLDKGKGKGW